MVHTCRPRRPLSNRSPESVKSGSILENAHSRHFHEQSVSVLQAASQTVSLRPAEQVCTHRFWALL